MSYPLDHSTPARGEQQRRAALAATHAALLAAALGLGLFLLSVDLSAPLRLSVAGAQPSGEATHAPKPESTEEGGIEPERIEEPAEAQAVIPPGQEDLLAEMLGRGATLPGQCQFANGAIDRSTIRASYKCQEGEVVFELRHPSTAPQDAKYTSRFAIVRKSGSSPPGLEEALVSSVTARESGFEWKWVGGSERKSDRVKPALVAGGGLAVVVLYWVVRRRRSVGS
jgi:hypothetical protein